MCAFLISLIRNTLQPPQINHPNINRWRAQSMRYELHRFLRGRYGLPPHQSPEISAKKKFAQEISAWGTNLSFRFRYFRFQGIIRQTGQNSSPVTFSPLGLLFIFYNFPLYFLLNLSFVVQMPRMRVLEYLLVLFYISLFLFRSNQFVSSLSKMKTVELS